MSIKSDLTVTENRACNIQTYKFALQIQLSEKRVFSKGHFTKGQFFSETDFTEGELCPNTISPRDKSVKTDHRQGGSAPSSRIKCTKGIRFQNRIDRTSSCHRQRRRFLFSHEGWYRSPTWDSGKNRQT